MTKVIKRSIIIVAILMGLMIPVYSYSSELFERLNTILPNNIYIDGIHIGGQTLIEVEKYIDEQIKERLKTEIIINTKDDTETIEYKVSLEELGLISNIDELKAEIWRILNNETRLLSKYQNYKLMESEGRDFSLEYSIDRKIFFEIMQRFDEQNLDKPVNAYYYYDNGEVNILGGVNGLTYDKEMLLKDIEDSLLGGNNIQRFTLDYRLVEPDITKESLQNQGINEKVASYTTTFNQSNVPRTTNVRLAAKLINGVILAPGDVFSFNDVVGKRTKERGFQEAGVYVNGRLDTGIGGGICQVSTTLYNAILIADLELVERSNHSLTVPYVQLSRDAAVSWGSKDLKFRNNTDNYIYIHSESRDNYITFDLHSTKSNKQAELVTNTLNITVPSFRYVDDYTMEIGREVIEDSGHTGYKSQLIKKVYVDGELINSQVISTDSYMMSPKIIRKGAKIINTLED